MPMAKPETHTKNTILEQGQKRRQKNLLNQIQSLGSVKTQYLKNQQNSKIVNNIKM